jgi:hypothetical protein
MPDDVLQELREEFESDLDAYMKEWTKSLADKISEGGAEGESE